MIILKKMLAERNTSVSCLDWTREILVCVENRGQEFQVLFIQKGWASLVESEEWRTDRLDLVDTLEDFEADLEDQINAEETKPESNEIPVEFGEKIEVWCFA